MLKTLLPYSISLSLFLFALSGCNPFVSQKGSEGQPCLADGTCKDGLECILGRCLSGAGDAGLDGQDGQDGDGWVDAGDLDPCADPNLDCSESGLAGQGRDQDFDLWGECCDCDDDNNLINPAAQEIPYDQMDNDCDPETLDDDLDQDSYSGADGSDCDDQNPNIHPGAAEDCNGLDDDCDSQTDEDLSTSLCPLQEGVCAGSMRDCLGVDGFSECDYGPYYASGPDNVCDALDNDCDGQTDEDGQMLLVPESGPHSSDGIDNNCNGLVDEKGGVMVPIPYRENVWIDSYESTLYDSPDCTGTRYGAGVDDYPAGFPPSGTASITLYSCSLPDQLPSGHLSWFRAQRACMAQGKRLCLRDEQSVACNGGTSMIFPYANVFVQGTCNDAIEGSGELELTGHYENCTSGHGTFDMSGNLAEWLNSDGAEECPECIVAAGGSFLPIHCDFGLYCYLCDMATDPTCEPFLRGNYSCWADTTWRRLYQPNLAYEHLGVRCCKDGP